MDGSNIVNKFSFHLLLKKLNKYKMKIVLEYVWIDGRRNLRSKYKTIDWIFHQELTLEDIPRWNYDGSSTYQATIENSEVTLVPVAFYKNPLFEGYLVLCETYLDDKPTSTNHRYYAKQTFKCSEEPWFGIEQEYFMMDKEGYVPLAFDGKFPDPQGDYYCGVGKIKFRAMAEEHYRHCLYAGLDISGVNVEVAPSQWEFQIGPCKGIDCADQLWIARYILQRVGEKYDVPVSFCPKPMPSPWNGSGMHTNFSTKKTRAENGLAVIEEYMSRLDDAHQEHLKVYGDNSIRLNGECETSKKDEFTWGYGDRSCSVRIPKQVLQYRSGYFEDRRPASDADPYEVTAILCKTCL